MRHQSSHTQNVWTPNTVSAAHFIHHRSVNIHFDSFVECQRSDDHLAWINSQKFDDVSLRCLRVGEDSPTPFGRERNQRSPKSALGDPDVLRMPLVQHVMNGHDARHTAHDRPGIRWRMQNIEAILRRREWEVSLLRQYPPTRLRGLILTPTNRNPGACRAKSSRSTSLTNMTYSLSASQACNAFSRLRT